MHQSLSSLLFPEYRRRVLGLVRALFQAHEHALEKALGVRPRTVLTLFSRTGPVAS